MLAGVCYGPLLDQGNHLVDTFRWFADSEVSWVMSAAEDDLDKLAPYLPTGMIPWSGDAHPSPRWMTHHLAFENGVRATMETGLLYRRSEPFIDDWLQRRVTAVGSGGTAECRASGFLRVTGTSTILEEPDRIERVADATVALHEDVRDAVLERRPVRASGEDALETLRVLLACERGRGRGRAGRGPLTMALRCVYTDLDGTLLGRYGSLFRDSEGEFSMLQARALEACHRAGVEVVIKSGRREGSVMEDAKLIGSRLLHLRGRLRSW